MVGREAQWLSAGHSHDQRYRGDHEEEQERHYDRADRFGNNAAQSPPCRTGRHQCSAEGASHN
jgi:hypothetical protein